MMTIHQFPYIHKVAKSFTMKSSKTNASRRKFIKQSTSASAGFLIVPRYVLGGKGFTAPSDMVNVGIVGVGGRGRQNVANLLALEDVRVSCMADPAEYWDLSEFYYRSSAGRGPVSDMIDQHYSAKDMAGDVKEYEDFRVMLEQESDLDAILCATPDHTHAYVCALSMRAGKHVYCEKPLTHNIWEARLLKSLADETGLATQMGNQRHSSSSLRDVVEILKAGVLGKIKEVHAWVPATRWIVDLKEIPTEERTLPHGFNWDLWLGPRAMRPFHDYYTPVNWRDFWDFGCGALGDFGCHDMDAPVWGLDLDMPATVEVKPAGFSNAEITPYGEIGYYDFDTSDGPLRMMWYSGGLQPAHPSLAPQDYNLPRRGALYVGENGIMISGGQDSPRLFPESLANDFTPPEPTLTPSNGHHRDWIDAIKGGPQASSNFDYATKLTEITLLGVLSLRLGGERLHWDAAAMKVTGNSDADPFIKEPIREGWEF